MNTVMWSSVFFLLVFMLLLTKANQMNNGIPLPQVKAKVIYTRIKLTNIV